MKNPESNNKLSSKSKTKPKVVISLVGIIAALTAVIALLLKNTGIGMGTSFAEESGPKVKEQSQTTITQEIIETVVSSTETSVEDIFDKTSSNLKIIVITNNIILIDNFETQNIEEFKEYLLSTHTEEVEYIINDNRALKSTYDEVKQILESYNYTYSETVQ